MSGSQGFDKSLRLRKRREFLSVQRRAQTKRARHFVVLSMVRPGARSPRMGVTVSRKVGNAVARNRVKRRVREFFRCNRNELFPNCDYVFIARKGAHVLSQAEVDQELRGAVP